jgi:hypothetical protein
MSTINAALGRLLAGGGGLVLVASLFLPWIDLGDGVSRSGWEAATTMDVLCLIAGLLGIAAAITGGRLGFFRPDVSLNGAADLVGVVATVLLAWWILFDLPQGASAAPGLFIALASAFAIACGAGDFRITSFFPALAGQDRRPAASVD